MADLPGYDAWKTRTPPDDEDPCWRCRKAQPDHGTVYCDTCLAEQELAQEHAEIMTIADDIKLVAVSLRGAPFEERALDALARLAANSQAIAEAEQRGRDAERAANHATERQVRQELWSYIRVSAGKSDLQAASVEWLDAWAPELVSGRFSDIDPSEQGAADE